MKKIFLNNNVFRLVTPPLYGTIIYILILLIFDSLDQLTDSFFSREVLITILLSYVLCESLRLLIILLDRKYSITRHFGIRVAIQLIAGIFCSFIVTSLFIIAYFFFIESYKILSSFLTELITFNIIFILTGIFYNLLYFSIYFLNHQNEIVLNKENTLRENLEFELQSYKNEINPELLYNSLEILVSLVHRNPETSDEFISRLSEVYRYKLEKKYDDLVSINEELKASGNLLFLLNYKYSDNIVFKENIPVEIKNNKIVHGTIQIIIENAVNKNIISSLSPLKINCSSDKSNSLIIKNKQNKRLNPEYSEYNKLDFIKKAYSFFTERDLDEKSESGDFIVTVPIIKNTDID